MSSVPLTPAHSECERMSSVPAEQARLRAATSEDLDAVCALRALVLLTTTAEDWL